MGITERHWFENEEPELTERQLQDIVYETKKAYDSGYVKGFHDALKEHPQIVRCKDCVCYKDCIFWNGSHAKCCEKHSLYPDENWFCADGKRKEGR